MLIKTLVGRSHTKISLELPDCWRKAIMDENWPLLDFYTGEFTSPGGIIFEALSPYKKFQSIERILSIRRHPDEDGIWHDDGSRVLAFTLSLMENPQDIIGGDLLIRPKCTDDDQIVRIPPQEYGTLLVFKTGVEGYEHRVLKVTQGMRIICAGWCT